ncbi:MAG: hypothetical protein ACLQGT_10120 [Terracidiphilus sp.]
MAKRLFRAGLVLGLAAALGAPLPARAQESLANAPEPTRAVKAPMLPGGLPDKPSQPPAYTIAVEALGFSAPGPLYMGLRASFVSLDFIDENRLLFTFRVPGLIRREAGENDTRQIRAVVLTLPAGTVEAEALWTVHDRARYLWMLNDGRFLLRDRENLELGDATLVLKPYLRFPGPLLWLEMDPAQKYLVTDSREPAGAAGKPGEVPTPESAKAIIDVDGQTSNRNADLAIRILRRDSGQVMLVSRSPALVHLPINSDGYLESLRARGDAWLLNLNFFTGGSRILGQVDSSCSPLFDFLSQREVLVTTCSANGAGKMVAMGTDGRRLWEAQTPDTTIWPLVVKAPDGLRLAWEALAASHSVSAGASLSPEEIKGQLVEVLNAADGKVALETAASPILDGGGNVAISPSGRRVAVLAGGIIQVFELPPPPLLPEPAIIAPALRRPGR